MKKAILAIAFILLLVMPVSSQGIIYFPVILKEPDMPDMTIGLVTPRLDYNEILNPSGEIAGNFSNVGTATSTRVTTFQKYGLYSYSVTTPANGDGIQLTTSSLTNAPHFFVARIRFMTPISLRFRLNGTTKNAVLLEKIDADWFLYGAFFSAAEASGGTLVQILRTGKPGPGTNGFYVDGAHAGPMPDANGGYSTYVDGTQEGCAWYGTPHGSRSYRSADSLAGGTVVDLFKKYGFFLKRVVGAGVVTPELSIDSYAQLPGGELNNEKTPSRVFSIIGEFYGNTEEDLHAKQQALELVLSSLSYPGTQQVRLRFYKSIVQKEIVATYSGGLEGDLPVYYCDYQPGDAQWIKTYKFLMPASIQFTATDPYWYEVGESAAVLDTNDTATFRLVAARLSNANGWSNLGPPSASGTYSAVYAIAEDNTYIYIGGDFLNWDNIAAADHIVRYNKQTGVYSAVGVGLNGIVYALAFAPNGDLYIGGEFSDAGGIAAADSLVMWNGAYNAVGASTVAIGIVYTLYFDIVGKLWIGGEFTNWNAIANADYIVTWDGSAYAAPAAPANGIVRTITGVGEYIYVGGEFTLIGGVTVTGIAVWNGTVYAAVGNSLGSAIVYAIAIWKGYVVIGTDTTPFLSILRNNTTWESLGGVAFDATVYSLAPAPDGDLLISGEFTVAGDYTADRLIKYNDYAYSHFDIDTPGTPVVHAIVPSKYDVDPITGLYALYIGFQTTGTGAFSGLETIVNEGTVPAYPKIIIVRSGGTGAILRSIRNERTGFTLLCDYSLLNGEIITIDLEPKNRQELSSYFPDIAIVLPNSNMSQWTLLPGSNNISAFVSESGSPTVTGYLLWRDAYRSYN